MLSAGPPASQSVAQRSRPVLKMIERRELRERHCLFRGGVFQNAPNLSPAVISRLTAEWQGEYERWQKRDLSARRYVYVWADGVFLQARMEDHGECMLVLIGATPEGKKELIGFQVGVRESAQSWRELLVEVKSRGLTIAPEIAVGDGALGFWKALDEVFPGTRHQRCWVHKTANVLNKVTLSVQTNMKKDLREIYLAPNRARPKWRSKTSRREVRSEIRQGRWITCARNTISCRRSSQVSEFENGIEVIQVPANHAA